MKVALALALACAVLAFVNANEVMSSMKMVKLPEDMLAEHQADVAVGRDDMHMPAEPAKMERRGGKGGKGGESSPAPQHGWGMPMGWGMPPMGWGGWGMPMPPHGGYGR